MLLELHVRELALIEEVWLEFAPGMTVLTGETGAGKTALVGALKLLLGDRADSSSVRAGADELLVEGRFSLGPTEIVASRRVSAEGRSRAKIDGEMATIGELGARLGPFVDLHGQHDHQALLSSSSHLGYLDRWAGPAVAKELGRYRISLVAYRDAQAARDQLAGRIADANARADYLRFVAEDIASLDPQPGESDLLEQKLPSLRHADRLLVATHDAVESLRGEAGAADSVGEALSSLERVAEVDPTLDAIVENVRAAVAALDDASGELRAYRDLVEADPVALDRTERRLAELAGLCKKYGPSLDDVLAKRDEALEALRAADEGEEGLADAEQRVLASAEDLRGAATALAAARENAVPGFVDALTAAARELAMDGARFEVSLTEMPFESWGEGGSQRLEFLFAPASAMPARPLAKIASGGEISRVMLALKGVLGHADDVPVLVFDEVDAGVGGATAHAIGRRLAQLAEAHQVIVVTHLAQVAAYADNHLVVEKLTDDGKASTSVRAVTSDARVDEIARMLSGATSSTGREHAEELLAKAREEALAQR